MVRLQQVLGGAGAQGKATTGSTPQEKGSHAVCIESSTPVGQGPSKALEQHAHVIPVQAGGSTAAVGVTTAEQGTAQDSRDEELLMYQVGIGERVHEERKQAIATCRYQAFIHFTNLLDKEQIPYEITGICHHIRTP